MKLFLHWLRWDIRRFSMMLRVWTYLLLAYTLILGWAHLNIFKIGESTVFLTWQLGGIMWGIGVFLLMLLLTADPPGGSRAFWKTRPPTGYAVAAVKVTLALVFFIGLPLVFLILMFAIVWPCSFLIAMGWPKLLIITGTIQVMTLSVMLLAAAVSGSPFHVGVKLIFWSGSLVLVWFITQVFWPLKDDWIPWIEREALRIHKVQRPIIYWICLGVGAGAYILARRLRTPDKRLGLIVILTPGFLFGMFRVYTSAPNLAKLDPSDAERIQVVRQSLRSHPFSGQLVAESHALADGNTMSLSMRVKYSGLPADARISYARHSDGGVFAPRWARVSLTTADGKFVAALPDVRSRIYPYQYAGQDSPGPDSYAWVAPVSFVSGELVPFSLTSCRLKGVLQVVLVKPKKTAVVSLADGLVHATPLGLLQVTASDNLRFATRQIWQAGDFDEIENAFLEHRISKERLPLRHGRGTLRAISPPGIAGLLPGTKLETGAFEVDRSAAPFVLARAKMASKGEKLDSEWALHVSKMEPYAVAEINVEFDSIFVPRQKDDQREVADIISAIQLSPNITSMERQRLIRYALMLTNLATGPVYADQFTFAMNNIDLKRRAQVLVDLKLRVQALELLLQSIHEEAIGDLLSAAASDLPSPSELFIPSDGPVRRRIMELLQPDDLPMLVEHPALIDYLHDELTRQKLIPKTGKRPMDHFIPLMSNDKLAATWRKDQEQPELSVEALKEALRRGIAWSMPAAAEVIELMLNSAAGTDLLNFLPSVSECPAERTEALKWIRQHAAHLIWDAALKKWVIPPTANLPAD